MARRVGRPHQLSNAEILVAARRVLLEHGCGVLAQVVARELGVSHTTLFNRFGSKEGLLIAALSPPPTIAWLAHRPGAAPRSRGSNGSKAPAAWLPATANR